MNRSIVCISISTLIFFILIGCASTPAASASDDTVNNKTDAVATVSPAAVSAENGTPLTLPSKEQLKKFSMDSEVLAYLETGSPDSIKKAVIRINDDPRGMTDQTRIALAVAGELMKILYPLETVTWVVPSVPDDNTYISAIRTARMGVYDYNTGNSDFLSMVLPSLVMAINANPGDYYTDAEGILQKAAAINQGSVLPPLFLAMLASRQGKENAAGNYFARAWKLDSSCYPAGMGYVGFLIRQKNGKTALDISKKLFARYPHSTDIIRLCAESAFVMGDWDTADSYVLQVLRAEPENTDFLLMRARILVERKEYLKANSLLDAYATKNRTDRDYLLLRARILREWNKNILSAIDILRQAQSLYPNDIEVMLASAEVSYQTGQKINNLGGRDFVLTVLKRNAENENALSLLASDYISVSDWTNAVRYAEKLQQEYPGKESGLLLSRAYIGSGYSSKAVTITRNLYLKNNADVTVIGLYLQALLNAGETQTAIGIIDDRMRNADSSLKSILYYYKSRLIIDPDARLSALRSSLLADPRNLQALYAMYEWYFDKQDYRKAQYYLKQVIALDPANSRWVKLQSDLEHLLAP